MVKCGLGAWLEYYDLVWLMIVWEAPPGRESSSARATVHILVGRNSNLIAKSLGPSFLTWKRSVCLKSQPPMSKIPYVLAANGRWGTHPLLTSLFPPHLSMHHQNLSPKAHCQWYLHWFPSLLTSLFLSATTPMPLMPLLWNPQVKNI